MALLEQCLCGSEKSTRIERMGLDIDQCLTCGLLRQSVNLSEAGYAAYYQKDYHNGKYYHSFEQDTKVANLRLDEYKLIKGSVILDVGCGNGAFVIEARKRGIDAYGVEVGEGASKSEYTYYGELASHCFPTDHFDIVTVHDVLEHLIDPITFLQDVRRILKQGGKLIIDLPNFYVPEGDHHWKEIEHLWFLNVEEMVTILQGAGFQMGEVKQPIPSKLVFYCVAPIEKRTSIVLPPGIGDSWWSLVKLRSFCEKNLLGIQIAI